MRHAQPETVKTVELRSRTPATPLKRGVNVKGACGRAPAPAQVQPAKRKDAEAQSRREIKSPSPNHQLHLCGSAALRLGVKIPCARFNAANVVCQTPTFGTGSNLKTAAQPRINTDEHRYQRLSEAEACIRFRALSPLKRVGADVRRLCIIAVTPGGKFEPPYVGSYSQGIDGAGNLEEPTRCNRVAVTGGPFFVKIQ